MGSLANPANLSTLSIPIGTVEDLVELLELDVSHDLDTDPASVVMSTDYTILTYSCRKASESCGFSLQLVQRGDGAGFDVYALGRHQHSPTVMDGGSGGQVDADGALNNDTDDAVTFLGIVSRLRGALKVVNQGSDTTTTTCPPPSDARSVDCKYGEVQVGTLVG